MATTEPGQPVQRRGGRGWVKWGAIGCAGLLLICVVIGVVSMLASGNNQNGTTVTKAGDGAAPAATPSPGVGDTVTAGNWEYTVTDVERTSEPLVWSDYGNQTEAKGEWVIVKMTLKNIGKKNFSINTHDFELVTGDGTKYSTSTEGGVSYGYHEHHKLSRLGEQMPPGLPIETAVIFDVAPNAQNLKLNLRQAKTMVDLSQG